MTKIHRLGVPIPDDIPHEVHDVAVMCVELEREKHLRHWEGGGALYWAELTAFNVELADCTTHVHQMQVDGFPLTERSAPVESQVDVFTETVRAAGELSGDRPDVLLVVCEDYALPGQRGLPAAARDWADVPGAVERRRVAAVTEWHDVCVVRDRFGTPRLVIDDVAHSVLSGDSLVRALRTLWVAYPDADSQ